MSSMTRSALPLLALLASLVGCGVSQSEACQSYLACQQYYDDLYEQDRADTNIYQPDGVCWENDDLRRECSIACEALQEDLITILNEEEQPLGDCAP
jgi:hypothetical protein